MGTTKPTEYTITPENGLAFTITQAQYDALNRKFLQNPDGSPNFYHFRHRVSTGVGLDGCIMIKWCGMWLGIETDGYTHS